MVLQVSSTGTLAFSVVHYHLLLAHCLSLWCITIFYWPTGPLYATLPSSIGQLALFSTLPSSLGPMAPSYVTLPFSTDPLVVSIVHYCLLMANWVSLWYTTIFYWPTGYLYGAQTSSTGPLALPRVLYNLLLAHWLPLWYTTIFYCPTGYLYGTLASPTDPLDIPMVYYPLQLAHLLSLWNITIF